MIARRRLMAGLAALGFAAPAWAQDPARPPGPLVGRFELTDNQPWIEVSIEGQGPFRFLIDTGASVAIIDPDLAKALKLQRLDDAQLQGATAERTVEMYVSSRVRVGDSLRQRGAVTFAAGQFGTGFDGVLPGALFTGANTEIDFAAREFRLYGAAQPDRSGFTRMPLVQPAGRPADGRLVVRVRLDGRPVNLLIDTGGAGSVLLSGEYVGKNGLWDRYKKWAPGEGQGIMTAFNLRLVRAGTLQLGPTRFDRPVVHLTDPFNPPGDGGDGVLGMDVLRRFTLSTDPAGKALWIKPNAAVKEPFRYNRAGFEARFIRPGEAEVRGLDPAGPAARAGLKDGDRLPSIADGRDLARFDWFLGEGPGTTLEFDAERDGMKFPVKLVLEELL
jgi:predicted aspartyl protease